jgi:large subunit ribosomal protein L9
MEVILCQNVKSLGKAGEKVKVTDGYARNFLFPKKLALPCSDKNFEKFRIQQEQEEAGKAREVRKAQELAQKIKKISCTIVKQVGEGEKLFGSVTVQDIVKSLSAEGIVLEKKQIILDDPIKTLGIYPVKIRLAPGIESVLKVWVVK